MVVGDFVGGETGVLVGGIIGVASTFYGLHKGPIYYRRAVVDRGLDLRLADATICRHVVGGFHASASLAAEGLRSIKRAVTLQGNEPILTRIATAGVAALFTGITLYVATTSL